MVATYKQHKGRVLTVAFSRDGKRVASGGDDRLVKLWDAATGNEIKSIKAHGHTVLSVAYSTDGRWLVSAGGDSLVKVWDAETGQETLSMRNYPSPEGVVFSSSGNRLVSSNGSMWDAQTGIRCSFRLGPAKPWCTQPGWRTAGSHQSL